MYSLGHSIYLWMYIINTPSSNYKSYYTLLLKTGGFWQYFEECKENGNAFSFSTLGSILWWHIGELFFHWSWCKKYDLGQHGRLSHLFCLMKIGNSALKNSQGVDLDQKVLISIKKTLQTDIKLKELTLYSQNLTAKGGY